MWVLNIDDDGDDRELFCDALKEIDPTIDCIAKSSAEDAIHLLNTTNSLPRWIFLDINMPKMGGIECLKTLRKDNRLAHIPITVLSTTTSSKEIDEVKKLGADFIAKEGKYNKYVKVLKSKIDLTS
jgi:CheY-like chemotaxis protein